MSDKEKVLGYAVWPERGNLVRFKKDTTELYCPTADGEDKWVYLPHLNEIRYGGGNAVEYTDLTEEEAAKWMEKLKKG